MLQKIDRAPAAFRVPEAQRVPLEPGDRIALVGRLHVTRHLLAESVLRFNQSPTHLCAFPTARLNRKGVLDGAFFGRVTRAAREGTILDNLEIEIYDLGPVPTDASLPRVKVAIAELYEHDRAETLERLFEFARRCDVKTVIAIVNSLDLEKSRILLGRGYSAIALRSFAFTGDEPRPTFASLDAAAPAACCYDVLVVPETSPAARALGRAHVRLVDALRACGDHPTPEFLRRAWQTHFTLSSIAVRPSAYERARRDLGRRSLRRDIEALREPRALADEAPAAKIVFVGWSHVVDALEAAYDELELGNPLSEMLLDRIMNEHGKLTVALSDRANRDALFTELVIGRDWKPGDVLVEHLGTLSRSRHHAPYVLTIGIDGVHRNDTALWSLLPDVVEATSYPHFAARHSRWVANCETQLRETLPGLTYAASRSLLGDEAVPIVRAAGHIESEIPKYDYGELRRTVAQDDEQAWATVQHDIVTRPETGDDELLRDDPDLVADEDSADDAASESLRVVFDDGDSQLFSPSAEVLVVEGDEVEARRVAALEPGDSILYLAAGGQRSAFETVRERTSHLIDVDERVIEWWRRSMTLLRHRYSVSDPLARARFLVEVYTRGCDKAEFTVVSWLRGGMMAPRDREDIETLVALSGFPADAPNLARQVHREITEVRTFYRSLGLRFRARMSGNAARAQDAVASAIDEFLDEADHRVVAIVEVVAGGLDGSPGPAR
jgi:hypothetical protein